MRCFKCGKDGHLQKWCREQGGGKPSSEVMGKFVRREDDRKEEKKCFNCGRYGHVQRFCRAVQGGRQMEGVKTCCTCGSAGHLQRWCPKKTAGQVIPELLMVVEAETESEETEVESEVTAGEREADTEENGKEAEVTDGGKEMIVGSPKVEMGGEAEAGVVLDDEDGSMMRDADESPAERMSEADDVVEERGERKNADERPVGRGAEIDDVMRGDGGKDGAVETDEVLTVQEKQEDRPPVAQVEVNGRKMEMLIDTGSPVSIINSREAELVPGLSIRKTKMKLRSFTGQELKVLGEATVTVKHAGQGEQVRVIVCDQQGCNFQFPTGCT